MSASEPPDVERLRAALERLGEEPGWPEPDADRLFSALHGDISAEDRRAVVDELVRNPRAAAEWRLARELAPEQASEQASEQAQPVGVRGSTWKWISLAAMLLLIVGTAWQLRRTEAPAYRSAEPRAIASLLPADRPLPREEVLLRWSPLDDARYRVRVLTPELDVIDEAEDLATAEYQVKPEAIRRIPAGGRLFWQVEARAPGTAPVVSPTFVTDLQ